jgi:hypothetical protein
VPPPSTDWYNEYALSASVPTSRGLVVTAHRVGEEKPLPVLKAIVKLVYGV